MGQSTFRVFLVSLVMNAAAGCEAVVDGDDPSTGSDYAGSAPSGAETGDADDASEDGDGVGDPPQDPAEEDPHESGTTGVVLETGCEPYGPDVYSPFPPNTVVSTGSVASHPWRGPDIYPDTIEDFRGYGPTLPAQVECGSNKGARAHLDVTAGCLAAVLDGGNARGKIQLTADGYYRSFALPYDASHDRRVAWDDQGVEYRFRYPTWTGTEGNPGFKAFVRYLTEYDLYVASWRRDGTVQIQKKQCGTYTILKRDPNYGAPSPDTWHTIRFEAEGTTLRLYLDGQLAMSVTDDSIAHGTAGIRIDSANGAVIDDWRTFAP